MKGTKCVKPKVARDWTSTCQSFRFSYALDQIHMVMKDASTTTEQCGYAKIILEMGKMAEELGLGVEYITTKLEDTNEEFVTDVECVFV